MARKAKKRRNRTPKVIIKKLPEKIIIKEESESDYYYNEEFNNTPEDKRFSEWTYGDAGYIKDLYNNPKGRFSSTLYINEPSKVSIRDEFPLFKGFTLKEQVEFRRMKVLPEHIKKTLEENEYNHFNRTIVDEV